MLKTLIALALTAMCAVEASADSSTRLGARQEQSQSVEAQPPAMPVEDSMARYQALTVEDIRWPDVPSEVDQKRWRELIPQKAGEPLDRDLIRESIHKLHDTGRFADVRVEAERTQDGKVSLSFFTAPNYFVGDIDVEGVPNRPTAGQVVNASKFQLGELFTPDQVERALTNIKRLMQENGYYRSSVSEQERKDPARQQIDIAFQINPGPQARVGTVTVAGQPGYSQGQIQDAAKMHSGDLVSVQRVSNSLDRLRKKYSKQNRLLAQVSISKKSYREEANAVDYTFDIIPGPKVQVTTEGFKIRRGVLKQNVPVFEENAVDEDLLSEGRRNLINYLQSRGYFAAKVGMKQHSDVAGNELQIVYVIDPGARHKLVKIEIAGNKYFLTERIRSRMQVRPAQRFASRGRYSQGLLSGDIHGIEDLYRANGFQQIKITGNVIDDYEGRENDLALEISVDEGPQTLVGAFHMEGNQAFSEEQLAAHINTAGGQPFSEFNIAQDRDNLLNYYFNHGFPQASFEAAAKPMPGEPNRMDVTFKIREGDRVFVDKVFVSGLNFTKPFVVQRELQVKSDDPLSQIDMLQTQQRLYDLSIFSQVGTAVQNPNGAEPKKNILVEVEEAKRYTFSYGVGLEFQTGQPSAVGTNQAKGQTGVSPRVSLGVTRLNFRGRNHTITFKADVGSLQQRGLLSYIAPRWFNSPDWKLSFTAFYDNTLDVTTFTSQRLEGSVQAEQTISKATTMDYRFTYRRVKASNIAISPAEIPLLSLPVRVGEPGFSYIRNKRDNNLESTKGSYTTIDAGVAASYFGSEADFSSILAQNSTYHAFGKNRPTEKKFVFARSLRIGVESTFGNTVILAPGLTCPNSAPNCTIIPLAERFFTGGGNSHRGFGLNQAGPRDSTTGFPVGGSALFLNNVELRFPPTTLPFVQDNISFAIFEDAGNIFIDGRRMLDNLLRWRQKNPQLCLQQSTANQCDYSYVSHAVGVGVRYRTPIGPVRFDFGYNLNPPAFPSFQTVTGTSGQTTTIFVPQHAPHFNVYFSIGQSF
ncbi:MAG TPA: POTRA domain-containing protein [Terriglobales bacterium]|nr:POTRA domain-containing protein [Terriglobales bacterium]